MSKRRQSDSSFPIVAREACSRLYAFALLQTRLRGIRDCDAKWSAHFDEKSNWLMDACRARLRFRRQRNIASRWKKVNYIFSWKSSKRIVVEIIVILEDELLQKWQEKEETFAWFSLFISCHSYEDLCLRWVPLYDLNWMTGGRPIECESSLNVDLTWKTYLLNRWFTYASSELRIELYFALQVSKLPISPQERRRNIIFRQVRYKGYLEQSQQFQAINSFPEEIMRLEGNVGKEKLDLL